VDRQYSAASDMANGQDTSILLFLARTYYQLGSKQQSFLPMTKALEHCVNALEIKPEDTIILHNIAMIQQKSAEIVLGLDPSKRSLQEVEQVIEQAQKSTE
jgi:RNA polymerase-associated protein CTR9